MQKIHTPFKIQYSAILMLAMLCLLSSCAPKNNTAVQSGTNPEAASQSQDSPAKGPNDSETDIHDKLSDTLSDTLSDNLPGNTPASIPEIGRIRQICELATLECYYHNVAKSKKSPGTGLKHLGETERIFWIEYTGIAELSFPVNQIQMEQDGTNITITLPNPNVTCKIDPNSWNEDSYVISEDQWLQKNPITAEDQTKAINLAQAEMIFKIRANSALLNTARLQAQELIKNYINQIGELTGVEYQIIWKES